MPDEKSYPPGDHILFVFPFFFGRLRVPTRRCDLVVPADWGWGHSNLVGSQLSHVCFFAIGREWVTKKQPGDEMDSGCF